MQKLNTHIIYHISISGYFNMFPLTKIETMEVYREWSKFAHVTSKYVYFQEYKLITEGTVFVIQSFSWVNQKRDKCYKTYLFLNLRNFKGMENTQTPKIATKSYIWNWAVDTQT